MLRCWVSVLGVLFLVRGTEDLWLLCSSVWSYRRLGKKSQVMVESVELGTKHLHPRMLQDGVLHPAAPLKAAAGRDSISTSPFQDMTGRDPIPSISSQGCCRKDFYICIPFPGCDRDASSSSPSQGCCRKGFCTQHLFSGMLQEEILCLASPLKDATGRKDFPSLVWNLNSSYEMHD